MIQDRPERWMRAAQALGSIDPSLIQPVQWLGRLDIQYIHEDQRCLYLEGDIRITEAEIRRFSDHYTLSYLWVLESYRVLSTVSGWIRQKRNLLSTDSCRMIIEAGELFDKVLIPLTKDEPSIRRTGFCPQVFFPFLHQESGIGGQVSADRFISRKELADVFLEVIEGVQEKKHEPEKKIREEPRAIFHQPVIYSSCRPSADTVLKGVTLNLSKSGMCLMTFTSLKKGQQIEINKGLDVPEPVTVRWVNKLDTDVYKAGLLISSRNA